MIKGRVIELGGVDYTIPPLNLAALERFQDRLEQYSGGLDKQSVTFVIEVAHAAIKRNYPEMTVEELKELIDLGNIHTVFGAVMNVSGLVARQDMGEALAPAASEPTGAESTLT